MARALLPRDLPVARWLEYYATRFDTVEINNSFYRLPDRSTFANWRTHVPPAFLFAVKASRFLTHMKRLLDPQVRFSDCSRACRFRPPARSSPLSTSADSHARPAASRPVSARPASKLGRRHTFTRRGVQTSVVVSRTPSSSSGGGASRCLHDKLGSAIREPLVGPFVLRPFPRHERSLPWQLLAPAARPVGARARGADTPRPPSLCLLQQRSRGGGHGKCADSAREDRQDSVVLVNADEPAVLEGLRRAPRSQVVVRHRFDEVELVSEFLRQRLRGVTDDGETAAHLRAIGRKRRHDHGACRFERASKVLPVSSAIPGLGQKMKDGAVVPDVHRLQRPVRCDVGLDPRKCECRPAETGLRAIQRGPRDVDAATQSSPRATSASTTRSHRRRHPARLRTKARCFHHPQRDRGQRLQQLTSRSPFAVKTLSQCCLRFIAFLLQPAHAMLHLAIRRGVAQSGRALGSGPRGRWFRIQSPRPLNSAT